MGSYDFGSGKGHFYSRNLWSSHRHALKAIFARLSLAPVCPINHGQQKGGFHPARRKPFYLRGVILLCKAATQHTDLIWVFGDTSLALRVDLWVLFYCLREWVPPILHSTRNQWSILFRSSSVYTMAISRIWGLDQLFLPWQGQRWCNREELLHHRWIQLREAQLRGHQ